MRDVRRRERLAGLKRTSKRESRAAAAPKLPTSKLREMPDNASNKRKLPLGNSAASSGSDLDVVKSRSRPRPVVWAAGESRLFSRTLSPEAVPSSWMLDPFCTLPGASEVPSMVEGLVYHCTFVFIPMTFPLDSRTRPNSGDQMDLMVSSVLSDPGSFFGVMSMNAAHRAILSGRHSDLLKSSGGDSRVLYDPDYYVMKAKCIREMNAKVRDPKRALSNEAFDTLITLLTGALIVGLFEEAKIHLKGLKRMVELRGGITGDGLRDEKGVLSAILTTDVKTAIGLMTKPVFPLAWVPQPLAPEIRQRLSLHISSALLGQLGTALFTNPFLSPPLVKALHGLQDLVLFHCIKDQNPEALGLEDHQAFRILNYETEHELASYPFRLPRNRDTGPQGTNLHPVESVARVASICYMNLFIIVSPPSSGLGRALTKHLKEAVGRCTPEVLAQLPRKCYDLFSWALFIGAHGSAGQIERPWFVQRLAHAAAVQGWKDWEEVADVLTGYFYISHIHDPIWRPVWDEAMALLSPF
ncbi:hypothetical protein VTN02DRAFT_2565 [Thermoascus thermophilus]